MKFKNIITGKEQESEPWQDELKVGDFYVNESPVAGVILNDGIGEFIQDLPKIYGKVIKATQRQGYFLVRAYSIYMEEGEVGLFCILDATRKITEEEFEQARARGWV